MNMRWAYIIDKDAILTFIDSLPEEVFTDQTLADKFLGKYLYKDMNKVFQTKCKFTSFVKDFINKGLILTHTENTDRSEKCKFYRIGFVDCLDSSDAISCDDCFIEMDFVVEMVEDFWYNENENPLNTAVNKAADLFLYNLEKKFRKFSKKYTINFE